jgi:hypothetical protein
VSPEFYKFVTDHGLGLFVLVMAIVWACERVIVSFVHRNRPVVQCNCTCCPHDADDEDEFEEEEEEEED